jgi:hypothetical protein
MRWPLIVALALLFDAAPALAKQPLERPRREEVTKKKRRPAKKRRRISKPAADIDRAVVRWSSRATGGNAKPQFITARELAFEARLEALTDASDPDQSYSDRHVRAAIQRHIAEVMLASSPVDQKPTPKQVAGYAEAARYLLTQRIALGLSSDERARLSGAEGLARWVAELFLALPPREEPRLQALRHEAVARTKLLQADKSKIFDAADKLARGETLDDEDARQLAVGRLTAAMLAEGFGPEEFEALLRRRARASWYLDKMVAPMLKPTELDLREAHRRGETPFTNQSFDAVRDPLERWYVSTSLSTAVERYFRNARSRVQVTLIRRPTRR